MPTCPFLPGHTMPGKEEDLVEEDATASLPLHTSTCVTTTFISPCHGDSGLVLQPHAATRLGWRRLHAWTLASVSPAPTAWVAPPYSPCKTIGRPPALAVAPSTVIPVSCSTGPHCTLCLVDIVLNGYHTTHTHTHTHNMHCLPMPVPRQHQTRSSLPWDIHGVGALPQHTPGTCHGTLCAKHAYHTSHSQFPASLPMACLPFRHFLCLWATRVHAICHSMHAIYPYCCMVHDLAHIPCYSFLLYYSICLPFSRSSAVPRINLCDHCCISPYHDAIHCRSKATIFIACPLRLYYTFSTAFTSVYPFYFYALPLLFLYYTPGFFATMLSYFPNSWRVGQTAARFLGRLYRHSCLVFFSICLVVSYASKTYLAISS